MVDKTEEKKSKILVEVIQKEQILVREISVWRWGNQVSELLTPPSVSSLYCRKMSQIFQKAKKRTLDTGEVSHDCLWALSVKNKI